MGLCIADIPVSAEVEVVMGEDEKYMGTVVHNYGSSLVMDCGGLCVLVDAMSAKVVKVAPKSAEAYKESITKRHDEFYKSLGRTK